MLKIRLKERKRKEKRKRKRERKETLVPLNIKSESLWQKKQRE